MKREPVKRREVTVEHVIVHYPFGESTETELSLTEDQRVLSITQSGAVSIIHIVKDANQ